MDFYLFSCWSTNSIPYRFCLQSSFLDCSGQPFSKLIALSLPLFCSRQYIGHYFFQRYWILFKFLLGQFGRRVQRCPPWSYFWILLSKLHRLCGRPYLLLVVYSFQSLHHIPHLVQRHKVFLGRFSCLLPLDLSKGLQSHYQKFDSEDHWAYLIPSFLLKNHLSNRLIYQHHIWRILFVGRSRYHRFVTVTFRLVQSYLGWTHLDKSQMFKDSVIFRFLHGICRLKSDPGRQNCLPWSFFRNDAHHFSKCLQKHYRHPRPFYLGLLFSLSGILLCTSLPQIQHHW